MKRFIKYLETYFRGPVGDARQREMFLAKGDMHAGGYKIRQVVSIDALEGYVTTYIRDYNLLRQWNVLMGVGYLAHDYDDYNYSTIRYDRVVYDFDSDDVDAAIKAALKFADALKRRYNTDSIVFSSGFKGAHVVVPLRRSITWDAYEVLWRQLLSHADKTYVDYNMLQWNRLDRVPLTYNVKSQGTRFTEIIWPRKLAWDDFTWDVFEPLDTIEIVRVSTPDVVKFTAPPRKQQADGDKKRDDWIWRVVNCGLPDGRHRFLLYTLIPRLVSNNLTEDEIIAIAHKFIENSCRRHNNCSKVYDSWIRAVIRSARAHSFRGFSLTSIQRRDQQLYNLIMQCLSQKLQAPAQT